MPHQNKWHSSSATSASSSAMIAYADYALSGISGRAEEEYLIKVKGEGW